MSMIPGSGSPLPAAETPLEACARSFYVPLAECMTGYGFGYGPDAWNPYVRELLDTDTDTDTAITTASASISGSESRQQAGAVLERYVHSFQPATVAEAVFGKGLEALPPELKHDPVVSEPFPRKVSVLRIPFFPMPWTPAGRLRLPARYYRESYNTKLKDEAQRTRATFRSIRDRGYEIRPEQARRAKSAVVLCVCLKLGEQTRYIVINGHHRLAALSALGYDRVPIALTREFIPVVDHENASFWPAVREGLYSKEAAQAMVRSFFTDDGRRKARSFGLLKAPL